MAKKVAPKISDELVEIKKPKRIKKVIEEKKEEEEKPEKETKTKKVTKKVKEEKLEKETKVKKVAKKVKEDKDIEQPKEVKKTKKQSEINEVKEYIKSFENILNEIILAIQYNNNDISLRINDLNDRLKKIEIYNANLHYPELILNKN